MMWNCRMGLRSSCLGRLLNIVQLSNSGNDGLSLKLICSLNIRTKLFGQKN
jgi:hypothetical protein